MKGQPGDRFRLVWSEEGYAIYRRTPLALRVLLWPFFRLADKSGKWWRITKVCDSDYEAWRELEESCVNRLVRAPDWHGVGYARANQMLALPSDGDPFQPDPGLNSYTTEPAWVNEQYVSQLRKWRFAELEERRKAGR
jgi:hypothetical protein